MEPNAPTDLWRWPLAVALGIATMSLAVIAAWIAHRGVMALPRWAYPVFSLVALAYAATVGVLTARRRRRKAMGELRPREDRAQEGADASSTKDSDVQR